jgi:hypothetical protein
MMDSKKIVIEFKPHRDASLIITESLSFETAIEIEKKFHDIGWFARIVELKTSWTIIPM